MVGTVFETQTTSAGDHQGVVAVVVGVAVAAAVEDDGVIEEVALALAGLAKAFEEKRGDGIASQAAYKRYELNCVLCARSEICVSCAGAEAAIVVRDQGPVLSPDKADAGTGRGQAAGDGTFCQIGPLSN